MTRSVSPALHIQADAVACLRRMGFDAFYEPVTDNEPRSALQRRKRFWHRPGGAMPASAASSVGALWALQAALCVLATTMQTAQPRRQGNSTRSLCNKPTRDGGACHNYAGTCPVDHKPFMRQAAARPSPSDSIALPPRPAQPPPPSDGLSAKAAAHFIAHPDDTMAVVETGTPLRLDTAQGAYDQHGEPTSGALAAVSGWLDAHSDAFDAYHSWVAASHDTDNSTATMRVVCIAERD